MSQAWRQAWWCVALLALGSGPALAHKGSDAYLDVRQTDTAAASGSSALAGYRSFGFVLAVAIKDLDLLVPVDANADGKVTWGEVKAAMPAVLAQANDAVALDNPPSALRPPAPSGAPDCAMHWQFDGLDRRGDGAYVRLAAQARCPAAQALALRYTLLRHQDANHRLLITGRIGTRDLLTTTSATLSTSLLLVEATAAASPTGTAAQAAHSGRWSALRSYFGLGVHHLLEGYDHLAFLLALLLPLRLALFSPTPTTGAAGVGVPGRQVWWALLRTVTAFTLGHSITLVLATLGSTQASSRWVEPMIAASIAVTALLNLRPVAWIRTDVLALVFGMVHGYGFAGLLQEAAAPSGLLPWALAGFNLGVEAGQLMAVGAWVLLSQPLVARPWYARLVVHGGSMALVLLACWWFWQRVR